MDKDLWTLARTILIQDEGIRDYPYIDSLGYATFGVGHNLVGNPLTREQWVRLTQLGFCRQFAQELFDMDLKKLEHLMAKRFPWALDLPQPQQLALHLALFQLGEATFSTFAPTWEHLRAGQLSQVEQHLRESLWFQQTPSRVERIICLIKEGIKK